MEKIFIYTITQKNESQTVEEFLRQSGYSKKLLIQLRNTENGLIINGKKVYTTHKLSQGELLYVTLPSQESSEHIIPVCMPLSIVYEDEHLLIINKEANVPIHPSQGNYDNTLANAVAYYFQEKGESFVYRAVNRLDRDTTGLLILAKHMLSACILNDMVKKRQIRREYLAIAKGMTDSFGTIDAPIARKDGSTIERCIDFEQGEQAVTHYRRLSYYPKQDCSLVSLSLETGRTHQIRVHMQSLHHPLLGDFLYNPDYHWIKRQSLHSWKLTFPHPITGIPMYFYVPLPDDMRFLFTNSSMNQISKAPPPITDDVLEIKGSPQHNANQLILVQ